MALDKAGKYVQTFVDPELTLDLTVGRTRVMSLKNAPRRVQVAVDAVAGANLISPTELLLQGRQVGQTILTIWFNDPAAPNKQETLTYLVRVTPDPEMKIRMERVYKALEDEINQLFCDSQIHLHMVGDKLVVTGRVKDVLEGTQILRIIRASAPGEYGQGSPMQIPVDRIHPTPPAPGPDGLPPPSLDNFLTAGGPNVINLLCVPGEQQVMLRVTVAEVNRTAARSIGLNFAVFRENGSLIIANTTGFQTGFSSGFINDGFGVGSFSGLVNIPVSLNTNRVQLAINALKSLGYARSLAEPTLTTLNGQPANFQAGGQFPVPLLGGGFGGVGAGGFLQGVQFIPYGVQVNFTPFITDHDRIRLAVQANVSARDTGIGTSIAGTGVAGLLTRNFCTTVELREGETLAVAGLIQNNIQAESSRVPFFADLPVIGQLTGLTQAQASEQELVILITPELVHPMKPGQVPPLPGSDLFEPNDLEFYLLGRIESHRPYDYRSPIRTDLSRQVQYQQLEKRYMYGPTGYSEEPGEHP
jgi:pilus assembly protein CpaC